MVWISSHRNLENLNIFKQKKAEAYQEIFSSSPVDGLRSIEG